ncbi:hypothetical protein Tco_1377798 [Tanacetum coccineum]
MDNKNGTKGTNWLLNDSYSHIILEDIYNTFYKDEVELAKDDKGNEKVEDKGKRKMDDKGKGKMDDLVDAFKKGMSKLMVSWKGTKKASVDLIDVLDLQNRIKKLLEDFNTFVKAKRQKRLRRQKLLNDTEIKMFKEKPTTSTFTRSGALTAFIRSRALIASTSNAQPAAPRGYRKIGMTGCVLSLRAHDDPNAPPPSTIRKRKP